MPSDESILLLAAAFKQRGMDTHVQLLREYWRARKRPGIKASWDDKHVLHIMAALQIPPYENVYRVLPRSGCCPDCRAGEPTAVRTKSVYPDRFVAWCFQCGAEWLVLA